MRCLVMFITGICLLFSHKLKWQKNKTVYDIDGNGAVWFAKYCEVTHGILRDPAWQGQLVGAGQSKLGKNYN